MKIVKRAIIFGATGGIGQAVCQELSENGWSLYLHCNKQLNLAKQLSQKLFKQYPQQDFIALQLNFLSSDEVLKKCINSLLPVNAAVFASGITEYGFLSEQKMHVIEKLIQINLTVPIKITKLLEPVLLKQSFSRIVYLGSVYGGQGSAMESVYSATKAGISRFAQAYSREVASANLTVNVVAPGAVDTPMNAIFSNKTLQEVRAEIPMGRLAKESDISFWIKTLLEQGSSYCNGQTIYVSGGWLL